MLAGAIASCATHPAEQARRDASGPRGVLPDVNPARAYLPLADITPAVSKPEPSEPVSPLSEQAVRRLTLARRLADEQRYTEALFEIERALRYDPNHPDLVRALAVLNWEAGNVQRAMIDARRAIESRPDDIRIHYILGRCEANAGSAGSAIAAYRTALLCSNVESQEELAALCRYHLAKALEQQGYLEAALGQYVEFEESATRIDESSASGELASLLQAKGGSAGQEKSIILERLGRFSEAAQALAKPAADSPDDAVLGLRHATLLMRAERLADALHAVRAIRTSDEAVLRLLAEVHERLGHPMGVIDDLRARAVRRPDDVNLVLALSEALMRFSRPQEAAQELREYLTRHPESVEVRTQLVEVLFTSSAWRDALLLCADAVREHPQDLAGYEMKITALAASEDAVTALLSHPAESGESHISCYFRGVLAAAAGRLEQAEQLLRASLARRATFLPARAALAGVYLRLHRYDDALSAAGREKDDLAEDARLERVLGQVYERLDDLEQAELHFRAAIQLDRADTESMFELASLHHRNGHVLQATRQLNVLLQEDPLHEDARELLAVLQLQEGALDAAMEQFKELEKSARTPTTKARCRAVLEHFQTRDAKVYRRTLLEAMEQSRPDARTWIAVAESYDRFDEAAEIKSAYMNALALDPDNEVAALGLIEAQRRLLDFESAAEELKSLLPRRPNRHSWRHELIDLYLIMQDYDAALTLAREQEARSELDDTARTRYRVAIIEALRLTDEDEEVLRQLKSWADDQPDEPAWPIRLAEEY
ncbi:MAG: tetratricopeptide repeat protein, partial [Phycisphaerae bacterium]